MKSLSDAIPREYFNSLFESVIEEVGSRHVDEYYSLDPHGASTVNLFVWDEGVTRGLVPDGAEMQNYHPKHLLKAYDLTKRRLKEDPFKEVFCTEFYNEHSDQPYEGRPVRWPFATIDLVHCYPNDIHIADMVLSDLTRPIFDRTSAAPRSHRGLHAFSPVLDGLRSVASDLGVERISLVAASKAAHDVFTRYGFEPTDTPVSQYAFRNLGFGHAMQLTL